MANYYLKYELSRSLNGNEIVYIARNFAGQVVFREASEEKLKKAIALYEDARRLEEEAREKVIAERAKAKEERAKNKKFLGNKLQEAVQERREESADEPPQGAPKADGPERDHLEGESESPATPSSAKTSFWDKLK